MRAVAVVFLLLTLAWLAQACSPVVEVGRDAAANCEHWDDMRRGVVACEQAGDRCAYDGDMKLVAVQSEAVSWECTCGTDIQIYWCKPVAK